MRILGIASVPEGRTGGMQRVSAGLPRMVGDVLCFTDDDANPSQTGSSGSVVESRDAAGAGGGNERWLPVMAR